jgi:hypothetical protein
MRAIWCVLVFSSIDSCFHAVRLISWTKEYLERSRFPSGSACFDQRGGGGQVRLATHCSGRDEHEEGKEFAATCILKLPCPRIKRKRQGKSSRTTTSIA